MLVDLARYTRLPVIAVLIAGAALQPALAASCNATADNTLTVALNPTRLVRAAVPPGVFGFTVDWFQFQSGHFRMGKVRPETVAWLKPFDGALYRYSGGNEFEWKNATTPITQRKPIYANYHGMAYPEFGPAEFFTMLQQVGGRATMLLNIAKKNNAVAAEPAITADNLGYLAWLAGTNPGCVSGAACPIAYFELGNEVDTEKPMQWSAAQYAARVLPLVSIATVLYPGIKFAAMGKTAPWNEGGADRNGNAFDRGVAPVLAPYVDSVTIHPYYDGHSVPFMANYIARLAQEYRAWNPAVKVLVTEHGRWPSVPVVGDWSQNWYQASGSGGGLSSADFSLMAIVNPMLAGAMWHTISVTGPWQLFHLNKSTDQVYPSATYWSLRTLREGFLKDAIEVTPALVPGTAYTGGYDMRLVGMKNASGALSLMGVNRSRYPKAVRIRVDGGAAAPGNMRVSLMESDLAGSDNTDAQPERFRMTSTQSAYAPSSPVCIPPNTTFSIVLGSAAP